MAKTSDNVNLDFPARMADGRIFTDYRPNCVMNKEYSQEKNSFDYRYFLTKNAQSIENSIIQQLEQAVKCQNCNQGKCTISLNDPGGLGLDRSNTYQQ